MNSRNTSGVKGILKQSNRSGIQPGLTQGNKSSNTYQTQNLLGNSQQQNLMGLSDNQSLANQYGIVRQKNNSNLAASINPNINIEDEYVQNLLKQIHFLNLEVKLMKEKQDESQGNIGIMGMLTKQGKPLIDHLIESQQKYKQMKINLTKKINELKQNLLYLDEKIQISDDVHKYYLDQLQNLKSSYDKLIEEQNQELEEQRKQYYEEDTKKNRIGEAYLKSITDKNSLEEQLEALEKYEEMRKRNQKRNEELLAEKKYITESELTHEKEIDQQLLDTINLKKQEIQNDVRYQKIKDDNETLIKELQEKQEQLFEEQYKAMEFEHRANLSLEQKEKEIQQRKDLEEKLDHKQLILEQQKKVNTEKIEKRLKESQSDEILEKKKQLELLIQKKQKLKEDFKKSEESQNKSSTEVYDKEIMLKKLQKLNQAKQEKNNLLISQNNSNQEVFSQIYEEYQLCKERKEKQQKAILKLREKYRTLKEQNIKLTQTENFLEEHSDLDKIISGMKIEEIKTVKDSNTNMNQTIEEFLQKWEQIKKFSKNIDSPLKMQYQ